MSSQKKASFGFLMRIVKILILEDPLELQKENPQIEPEKKNPKISKKTIISLLILIIMMLIFFAFKSNESREKVHLDDSKQNPKPKLK